MVTRYGMSGSLLPRTFGKREDMVFLGREISEQRDYSEKVAQEIDEEVQNIVVEAYHTAKRILLEQYPKLTQIARHLMQNETVEGTDLEALFNSDAPPLEGAMPAGA